MSRPYILTHFDLLTFWTSKILSPLLKPPSWHLIFAKHFYVLTWIQYISHQIWITQMRESRAYLELTGRDKKMDVKHSTRNKLRGKSRTKGWVDRAASPTRTSSRWARQRGGPRPKKARRRRGELWEEEEVGKSNDKFLGPGVPGVAGDNSRVWGGFDDYRFFTQQRSGGGHR